MIINGVFQNNRLLWSRACYSGSQWPCAWADTATRQHTAKEISSGMQSLGKRVFTTPICPTLSINQSTYSHGFSAGYEKATGKSTTVIPGKGKNSGGASTDAFCVGREDGYRAAQQEQNKRIYTVPVCPVPSVNQNNYDGGFVKGYKEGGGASGSFTPVQKDGDFCDGWEKGYAFGLQLWAETNNKRTPLKITPVCPVPGITKIITRMVLNREKTAPSKI